MDNILQFPTKKDFIAKNASDFPVQMQHCFSLAYDEIMEKSNNIPDSILVNPEHKAVVLELLSELLKEKSEACHLKYQLSTMKV